MNLSNFVAYVKQAWKNKPDTSTPLSAERLTHQEEGIKGNSDAIQELAAAVVSQIVNNPDKIASMAALYAVNQKVTTLDGKVGDTAQLPSGTADVASAVAQLYSNMNALTDSSISIPSGSPVTGNRVNAKIYQNSFLVLSGEVSIDFTNLKNWNGYNILQCANSSRYNVNFIAIDENGGSFHMQIDTNGIIRLTIRGYLPENKSQILRFFCIAPLMPA